MSDAESSFIYIYINAGVVYINLNTQVDMLLYKHTFLHIAEYTGGYDDIKIFRLTMPCIIHTSEYTGG